MNEPTPRDLSKLHDGLNVVCDFLDSHDFAYAIVGGIAVAIWGEPRATFDVDLMVATEAGDEERLLAAIRSEPAFLLEPQLLPMPPEINIIRAHLLDKQAKDPTIILVDLLLLSAEFAASLRARRVAMAVAGKIRWVSSPEDLIVLKLLSGRVKDIEDARGICRITNKGQIERKLRADVGDSSQLRRELAARHGVEDFRRFSSSSAVISRIREESVNSHRHLHRIPSPTVYGSRTNRHPTTGDPP